MHDNTTTCLLDTLVVLLGASFLLRFLMVKFISLYPVDVRETGVMLESIKMARIAMYYEKTVIIIQIQTASKGKCMLKL